MKPTDPWLRECRLDRIRYHIRVTALDVVLMGAAAILITCWIYYAVTI
jgi:hypothetical protein